MFTDLNDLHHNVRCGMKLDLVENESIVMQRRFPGMPSELL